MWEREIPWDRATSYEHRSSRAPICDLRRSATSDDKGRTSDELTTSRQGRRATKRAVPASDVTVGVSPWVWFALGLGFGFLCIGFFLFFKQICIAVLGNGVWFAFALYGLYLVFSANNVTVDWFLICSVLVFYFLFFLGENPWVCYLRIMLG